MDASSDLPVRIRSFRPSDQRGCQRMYLEGQIGGQIADNDTGFDISDIHAAYMKCPGGHFWVAETPEGEIVGTIGVQQHDQGVGEVRRLRVRNDYRRRGIGSALMEAALGFCQEKGYLKVTLDTFMEREPAVRLFEKFRFRHSRTKKVNEKDLMYFYLDLYMSDHRPHGDPEHA